MERNTARISSSLMMYFEETTILYFDELTLTVKLRRKNGCFRKIGEATTCVSQGHRIELVVRNFCDRGSDLRLLFFPPSHLGKHFVDVPILIDDQNRRFGIGRDLLSGGQHPDATSWAEIKVDSATLPAF
jgi:hypothetical protein